MSPLVLDLILAAVVLLVAVIFAKRGFYKILMPLLVFVAAVVVAGFLSNSLKAPVTDAVFPKVESKVVAALEQTDLKAPNPEALFDNAVALLPEGLQPLAQRLEESLTQFLTVDVDPEAAVLDMARALTEAVVRIVLWLILFLAALLVFSLLKKVVGLVFKLPIISWLDHAGGFVLGLGFILFALYALGWILTVFGITYLHELGEGTRLFSRFF